MENFAGRIIVCNHHVILHFLFVLHIDLMCDACTFYAVNKELWKEDGEDSCKLIDFRNENMKRHAMDDAELMMAVDKYISHVHINKSTEIHEKLLIAYKEKTSEFDDGDTSNDAYQKLIPTPVGMH